MDSLTIIEHQELTHHEAIIERGLQTFTEVGNALLAIRDRRLYRKDYSTFEEYCRRKWNMSQRHANRLVASAAVIQNLGPIGLIPSPANEAQARPLASLAPEQQRKAWALAVETAPIDKEGQPYITAAHVQKVADETTQHPRAASQPVEVTIFSHKSEEYYTPPEYVEAARKVMGAIDLDPASCKAAQGWIRATQFYTKEDNGLQRKWEGRCWLNPPYSKTNGKSNQATWSQKLIDEYQSGRVSEAILLVKAALGYKWFEDFWCDWPVCFARERLSFIRANGSSDGQSKQGTAFFYFGDNIERFREIFSQFGRVIMPDD
jgi:hypothetical protein